MTTAWMRRAPGVGCRSPGLRHLGPGARPWDRRTNPAGTRCASGLRRLFRKPSPPKAPGAAEAAAEAPPVSKAAAAGSAGRCGSRRRALSVSKAAPRRRLFRKPPLPEASGAAGAAAGRRLFRKPPPEAPCAARKPPPVLAAAAEAPPVSKAAAAGSAGRCGSRRRALSVSKAAPRRRLFRKPPLPEASGAAGAAAGRRLFRKPPPVSQAATAGSAGCCGTRPRRKHRCCLKTAPPARTASAPPMQGAPVPIGNSTVRPGGREFRGARPWGRVARHGASVDSWSMTKGSPGVRSVHEQGMDSARRSFARTGRCFSLALRISWGARGRHVRRHGFSTRARRASPALEARDQGARHALGASSSRPAPVGAASGRQRHGGAREDFPALKTAAGWRHKKNAPGAEALGALWRMPGNGRAPEPEGSGAEERCLRRRGPSRMLPGAAPAGGRPPAPAWGRGS